MDGAWTRALIDPTELHDFCKNGIFQAHKRQAAPNYIPAVFSVPTESGSKWEEPEYSSIESEEEDLTCFRLKKNEKSKPKSPILVRKRSAVLEKVPNFRASGINSAHTTPTTARRANLNNINCTTNKSESMSVLKSITTEGTIDTRIASTKFASSPDIYNQVVPKNATLLGNCKEGTEHVGTKKFKYKQFLTERYSIDLEAENQQMKNLLRCEKITNIEEDQKTMEDDQNEELISITKYEAHDTTVYGTLQGVGVNETVFEIEKDLGHCKENKFDMEAFETAQEYIAFHSVECDTEEEYANFDDSGHPLDSHYTGLKLQECSNISNHLISFQYEGQPVDSQVTIQRIEQENCDVLKMQECSIESNISNHFMNVDDEGQPLESQINDKENYESNMPNHFKSFDDSTVIDVFDDSPTSQNNKSSENITEDEQQTLNTSNLSICSNFSDIEEQNNSEFKEGEYNVKYASFDDNGIVVTQTIYEGQQEDIGDLDSKFNENNEKVKNQIKSTIEDISGDCQSNMLDASDDEYNPGYSNSIHFEEKIKNDKKSISKEKHLNDKFQEQKNKSNNVQQQNSIDSSLSITSAEIPDLEILTVVQFVEKEELLVSAMNRRRLSRQAHTQCEMSDDEVTNVHNSGIVFIDRSGRVLARSTENSTKNQIVIKKVGSRLLSGTLPSVFSKHESDLLDDKVEELSTVLSKIE